MPVQRIELLLFRLRGCCGKCGEAAMNPWNRKKPPLSRVGIGAVDFGRAGKVRVHEILRAQPAALPTGWGQEVRWHRVRCRFLRRRRTRSGLRRLIGRTVAGIRRRRIAATGGDHDCGRADTALMERRAPENFNREYMANLLWLGVRSVHNPVKREPCMRLP